MVEIRSPDGWWVRVLFREVGCAVSYVPRVEYAHGARLVVGVRGVRARGVPVPGAPEEAVHLGDLPWDPLFVAATISACPLGLLMTFTALEASPLVDGLDYEILEGTKSVARARFERHATEDLLVLDTGEAVFQAREFVDRLWPCGASLPPPGTIFASDV